MQLKDLLAAQLEGKKNTLLFLQELLSSQMNLDLRVRLKHSINELETSIKALEVQIQSLSE